MVEYLDPGPWPGFIGDRREKFIRLTLGSGEEIEYSEVLFYISADEFVVSPDESHTNTIHYNITEVSRLEVIQHHTACFVTTAVADDQAVLNALRSFRDQSMAQSVMGRSLLRVYDVISPPIAETLGHHPNARTTRAIRWFVRQCAALARLRRHQESPVARRVLSVTLVALYLIGLLLGIAAHLANRSSIRLSAP